MPDAATQNRHRSRRRPRRNRRRLRPRRLGLPRAPPRAPPLSRRPRFLLRTSRHRRSDRQLPARPHRPLHLPHRSLPPPRRAGRDPLVRPLHLPHPRRPTQHHPARPAACALSLHAGLSPRTRLLPHRQARHRARPRRLHARPSARHRRELRPLAPSPRPDPAAIARFWQPVLVCALNEDLDRISVHYAAKVFRESFLLSPQSGRMGIPSIPFSDLYGRAIGYMRHAAAKSSSAPASRASPPHIGGWITAAGNPDIPALPSDAVVLALSFEAMAALLPALPQNPASKSSPRASPSSSTRPSPASTSGSIAR